MRRLLFALLFVATPALAQGCTAEAGVAQRARRLYPAGLRGFCRAGGGLETGIAAPCEAPSEAALARRGRALPALPAMRGFRSCASGRCSLTTGWSGRVDPRGIALSRQRSSPSSRRCRSGGAAGRWRCRFNATTCAVRHRRGNACHCRGQRRAAGESIAAATAGWPRHQRDGDDGIAAADYARRADPTTARREVLEELGRGARGRARDIMLCRRSAASRNGRAGPLWRSDNSLVLIGGSSPHRRFHPRLIEAAGPWAGHDATVALEAANVQRTSLRSRHDRGGAGRPAADDAYATSSSTPTSSKCHRCHPAQARASPWAFPHSTLMPRTRRAFSEPFEPPALSCCWSRRSLAASACVRLGRGPRAATARCCSTRPARC